MRGALLPVLLAAAVAVPAQGQDRPAQTADTVAVPTSRADAPSEIPPPARRATTLALPNGRGVFYYRAGEPGGVRIRSRAGQRPAAPAAQATAPQGITRDMVREALRPILDEFVAARAPRAGASPSAGVSDLDLVLLEQNLLRALDRRLAGLDTGRDRTTYAPSSDQPTVVVVPSQTAPVTPTPEAPPQPAPAPQNPTPPPPAPTVEPLPQTPVDPIVAEVERAILDTGLLVTNRVNFEFGEATLLPISEQLLGTIGDVLLEYPEVRIRIGGHTDSISSEAFNLQLSMDRANAVRDFLIGYGVDADRLEAVGYGEGEPIATNETETGRALNRRVEFTVLNPGDVERRTVRPTPDQSEADLRRIIREELERLRDSDG